MSLNRMIMPNMRKKTSFFFFVIMMMCTICACGQEESIIDGVDEQSEESNAPVPDVATYPDLEMLFDYLCSSELGGRYSGSEGIGRAVEYMTNYIGLSDSLRVDTFDTNKCVMRNIIYHINGVSDSLIVLGAHYDAYGFNTKTPLPGADDNMSGTATLLTVIKFLQKKPINPPYSIDICFFDGEEIGRYGSRHYISQSKKGIKKYINIDTCGNKDFGLVVLYDETNPSLKKEFDDFILLVNNIRMKTGVYNPKGYTTDCEGFKSRHIPYVSIQNEKSSGNNHTMRDNVSHISFEKIFNLAKGLELYLNNL